MGRGLFRLWRRPTTAALSVLALVLASALISAAAASPAGAQTLSYTIYDDAFARGWEVRNGTRALADTAAADPLEDDQALEISLSGGPAELLISTLDGVDSASYNTLHFDFYAAEKATVELTLLDSTGSPIGDPVPVGPAKGEGESWIAVEVPARSPSFAGIKWAKSGGAAELFYVDNILLSGESAPAPTETATPVDPTETPTLAPTTTATPDPSPTAEPSPTPPPAGAANRVDGYYLHGVNVPWINWAADFGGPIPGDTGSGPSLSQLVLDAGVLKTSSPVVQTFAQLEQWNVHAVNWWMFQANDETGPYQIERDNNNCPIGIKANVHDDIEAALQIAEAYDLYYTFDLFNRLQYLPRQWWDQSDPGFCGSDGPTGFALFDDVLGPQLFARYAGEPHIFTWEALVEPEWDVNTWAHGRPLFTEAQLRAFVANFAKSVHANSDKHATVNMAMIDALYLYTDLEQSFGEGTGLDYYSTSWYDYMSSGNWCALCRTYADIDAQYGLGGKPLVIGEFFAGTGDYRDDNHEPVDATTRLDTWLDHGYAGAYAWSLFWDSTGDKMQVEPGAYTQFGQEQAPIIGPLQLP